MRAAFYRPDQPDHVVGTADWSAGEVRISSEDEQVRAALERVVRPAPLPADDPAFRGAGTMGPVVLQPGTLRWFTAAARSRAESEGLAVRFVPRSAPGTGWDPAGSYRPFTAVVERIDSPPSTA